MRCSGKQHLYPKEIERFNKETKERKFNAVIDQAKSNKDSLVVLDEKIKSQSEKIMVTLQSDIENVTEALDDESEEWKQEIEALKYDLKEVREQQQLLIDDLKKNCTDVINDLSFKLDGFSSNITDEIALLESHAITNITSLSLISSSLSSNLSSLSSTVDANVISNATLEQLIEDKVFDLSIQVMLSNKLSKTKSIALWNMDGQFPEKKVRICTY